MSVSEALRAMDAAMTPQMPNRWVWELERGNFMLRVLAPAGVWVEIPYDQADAEGIATLRNALPLLADVVEAAEKVMERRPETSRPIPAALAALASELERDGHTDV